MDYRGRGARRGGGRCGGLYERAYDLARMHGESGWTARLIPLTVDGLIYAISMLMRDSARRKRPDPALARWLLGLGIAATLAANVAHGLGHALIDAAVAAWPSGGAGDVSCCEVAMSLSQPGGHAARQGCR